MAVRDDFTAGEVLTAADLNDTFGSKVDYALPVNAQTGTAYTFVAADAEKLTTASNGSAVTLTIPPASSVAWPDETILRVVNYGAGAVTIDGGSGVTVTNTSSTVAQYGAAVAIRTGSDAWTVVPFGGGDGNQYATISSPSATGTYTDGNGIEWNYYTITATGSVTFTDGLADILVVGGGGGAWGSGGPGGGSGGMRWGTYEVAAGSYTFTIGAGGAVGGDGNTTEAGTILKVGGGMQGRRQSSWGVVGHGGGGSGGGLVSSASTLAGGGAGGTVYGSNHYDGITINYDNTSTERGIGGYTGGAGAANTGNGGAPNGAYAGGSGVVIVRLKV